MDWSEVKLDIESLKKLPKETQGEIFSKITDAAIIYNILLAYKKAFNKEKEYYAFILSNIKRIDDSDDMVEHSLFVELLIKNAYLFKNLIYSEIVITVREKDVFAFPKLIDLQVLLSNATINKIESNANFDPIVDILKKMKYNEKFDEFSEDICCQNLPISIEFIYLVPGDPLDEPLFDTFVEYSRGNSILNIYESHISIDSLIEYTKVKKISLNANNIVINQEHKSVETVDHTFTRKVLNLPFLRKVFPKINYLILNDNRVHIKENDFNIKTLKIYIDRSLDEMPDLKFLNELNVLKLYVRKVNINIMPLISNIRQFYKGRIEVKYAHVDVSNLFFVETL